MHNRHDGSTSPLSAGLLLIAIGLMFLLDHLDVLSFGYIVRKFWPVILIIVGASRLRAYLDSNREIREGK